MVPWRPTSGRTEVSLKRKFYSYIVKHIASKTKQTITRPLNVQNIYLGIFNYYYTGRFSGDNKSNKFLVTKKLIYLRSRNSLSLSQTLYKGGALSNSLRHILWSSTMKGLLWSERNIVDYYFKLCLYYFAVIIIAVCALFSISSVFSTPIGKSCCGCQAHPPITGNPKLYGPSCLSNQLLTLWPDCQAFSIFYQCLSVGQFTPMSCAAGTFFSFEKQKCVNSADFEVSAYCNSLVQGPVPPILDDHNMTPTCSCCQGWFMKFIEKVQIKYPWHTI